MRRSPTTLSTCHQLSPEVLQIFHDALGYAPDPTKGSDPYIDYILAQWPGRRTLDDYVRLLVKVLEYFTAGDDHDTKGLTLRRSKSKSGTIKQFIEALVADLTHPYFQENPTLSNVREIDVTDIVLLLLGSLTLMQGYFTPLRGDKRRILQAYCSNNGKDFSESLGLGETLPDLLSKSGLLPSPLEGSFAKEGKDACASRKCEELKLTSQFALHPSLGMVESLEIASTALNAFKLFNLGAVRILWTNNMSRHMLLSNHAQKCYLELFALPSALESGPSKILYATGISEVLMEEIQNSYANLFNPRKPSALHRYFGSIFGLRFWCWCLSCSSGRLVDSQIRMLKAQSPSVSGPQESRLTDSTRPKYDPALEKLMRKDPRWWDQTEFEHLWPRIVALDAHLSGSKPWSFWVIFRDRRDSVQFWTFLFGTVILALTLVQVFLGVAQVVGSFK